MRHILIFIFTTLAFAVSAQGILKQGGFILSGTANGQHATWNGTTWVASDLAITSNAPLTGNGTAASPLKLTDGTAAGQVLTWNGSAWSASALSVNVDPSLDGDGSTTSPLMIAGADLATPGQFLIASGSGAVLWDDLSIGNTLTGDGVGSVLNIAQQGATSGQVLKWNGTTWAPAADAGTTYTAGTGINVTGTVISNTGDLSATNEGSLTVGAGGANSSTIVSNTSGSTDVTIAGGANVTVTESGGTITIAASSGSGTDLSITGTSSPLTLNSSSGGDVTLTQGGIVTLTGSSSNVTISATEVDGSLTNEGSLSVGAGTSTTSLITSNTSGSPSVTLTAGTGLAISESGNVITLDATDATVTNEGTLGVSAGSSTTSVITSNTSSAAGVTLTAGNNLTISETTSANGGTITLDGARLRKESFTATAGQTAFTLSGPSYAAPSGTLMQLMVFRNGVELEYVASAPTFAQFTYSANIVTTSSNALNDVITIKYINP